MGTVLNDIIRSLRNLRRQKATTLVIVLCLGLGIGANTAVFSLANTLFFQALPVPEPEEMVRVYTSYKDGLKWGAMSYPDFRDFERLDSGVTLGAEVVHAVNMSAGDTQERLFGALVTGRYFSLLGLAPQVGRFIAPDDATAPGSRPVAVLSDGLWRRHFDADPGVVGRDVFINGRNYSVIGVAPAELKGTNVGFSPELWLPITMEPALNPGSKMLSTRNSRSLLVIGRLDAGAGIAKAQSALNLAASQLAADYPSSNQGTSITVIPESEGGVHPMFRGSLQGALVVLQGFVALVLLISCVNVAVILISKAAERRQEVAVRLALGSGRLALIRQLVTESVVLAALAGCFGLALASTIQWFLGSFQPLPNLPLSLDIGLDWRVMLFTIGVSLGTGVLFGLVPALQSTRTDLVTALKSKSSDQPAKRARLQEALVVGQISITLILLITAGLLVRGLSNARQIDLGFEPDRVLTTSVDLGSHGYETERGYGFYRRSVELIESLPQVRSAAWVATLPLTPISSQIRAADELGTKDDEKLVDYTVVSEGYFETLGIPTVSGRVFGPTDNRETRNVAVVNQTLAKQIWPGQDPLGRRISSDGNVYEVVGVVKDGKYVHVGEDPKPFLYLPLSQRYRSNLTLVVSTRSEPALLTQAVLQEIRSLDRALVAYDTRPLNEHLEASLMPVRAGVTILSAFGLLAVLLAAIGLYGILAYSVSQRMREIAIRMAIGADRGTILKSVLWQGMRLAIVGSFVGVLASVGVTRLLGKMLYGVHPLDPAAFLVGSLLLASIALISSYFPARRALRASPAQTLRAQ